MIGVSISLVEVVAIQDVLEEKVAEYVFKKKLRVLPNSSHSHGGYCCMGIA